MELTPLQDRRRVLVVEDEPLIALDIVAMLEGIGFGIAGVTGDLSKALELAQGPEVDAALLDILLGTESSFAVADVLARRGIPFIFSTGTDGSSIPEHLQNSPLIAKPYDSEVARDYRHSRVRHRPGG